jgi:hypothetical protein
MLTQSATIHMLSSRLAAYEADLERGAKAELLRAEVGLIGELYVAVMTNGQLADQNNQPGYDVVSETGERISVKTTQRESANVTFNASTFNKVDRVVVIRVENTDEQGVVIRTVYDDAGDEMRARLGPSLRFYEGTTREPRDLSKMSVAFSAEFEGYRIVQLENASILVYAPSGEPVSVVRPVLQKLAARLDVPIVNGTGTLKNTRQLGDHVIKAATVKALV